MSDTHGVFKRGGPISNPANPRVPVFTGTQEECKDFAGYHNSLRTPMDRNYYKILYTVRKLKEVKPNGKIR